MLKARGARGKQDNLYFWRSHAGHEVDVIADEGERLRPIEIKSGSTIASDWFDSLLRWIDLAGTTARKPTLVYGGKSGQTRKGVDVIPWNEIGRLARSV